MIDFLAFRHKRGDRSVMLPEVPILYAVTNTEAPSRWYDLAPPGVLSPAQEELYISDLSYAIPKFILYCNWPASKHGHPYFGIDYDQRVYGWITENYRLADNIGDFRMDQPRKLSALVFERSQ
jgi:hypothetical protein